MKVTKHSGTRSFAFHRAMGDLSHPHFLKALTSFVSSSKYHLIHEKVSSSVEKFMGMHFNLQTLPYLSPGHLAQQLSRLADALSYIHNQGQSNLDSSTSVLVPRQTPQKAGCIRDIKPENLLMFVYNQDGKKAYWFRLSDFSCTRVVDVLATMSGKNRNRWITASSGTPVYRAPEVKSSLLADRWYRAPEAAVEATPSQPYDL